MNAHHGNAAWRDMRGAMSVELALLLACFLMPLLAGIVDFGQILHAQSAVTRAAREGAIAASRNQEIDEAVTASMQNAGYDLAKTQVTTEGTRTSGEPVTVTVSYDIRSLVIIPWDAMVPQLSRVMASATAQQF